MRKTVGVSLLLIFMAGIAHSSSFITLNKGSLNNSMVAPKPAAKNIATYGPSINDCARISCPSAEKMDRLARKGTNVMKISGGEVEFAPKVFAPMPKPKDIKESDMLAALSQHKEIGAQNNSAISAVTGQLPDAFKTGPLPNGTIQDNIAGVDTEYLPDIARGFEQELSSNNDDPIVLLENVSFENMQNLTKAY